MHRRANGTALCTHRLGKLLVLGAVLGCVAPAATLAACLSHKSPFAAPTQPDKKQEADRARLALAEKGQSVLTSDTVWGAGVCRGGPPCIRVDRGPCQVT